MLALITPVRTGLLATVVFVLGFAAAAPAQSTWYVDDDALNDPGPGDPNVSDPDEDGSPEHPFDAIQEGIDAAADGDTVVALDGTYTGTGNKNLDFGGGAITVRSANGFDNCIIDCEGDRAAFHFNSGEGLDTVVEGFTLTNGSNSNGGAITCYHSSPTINNCWIHGNAATYYGGGAVYADQSSSPIIRKCILSENSSPSYGGAIYCISGDPIIEDCVIRANVAAGRGGGICYRGSRTHGNPTIRDCTIVGNSSTSQTGGGISCASQGLAVISGCLVRGNDAIHGGGIRLSRGDSTLTGCTISQNGALDDGGGLYLEYGNPTVSNCTFSENTSDRGGGIYSYCNYASVVNVTLSHNVAGVGGGLANDGASLTLANSILWDDEANPGFGPEIALLWTNTGIPCEVPVSYCDVRGGQADVYVEPSCTLIWGDGNIDADPFFAFGEDSHLMVDSPCIDAGTNEPPGGLPSTDADGNERPLDGDGDDTAVADMGAYEFNRDAPSIALAPSQLTYFALLGGANPDDQALSIRNCGGGTLYWEIAEACDWLEVTPSSGDSAGEVDEVSVQVDIGGLPDGKYVCTLEVWDRRRSTAHATLA